MTRSTFRNNRVNDFWGGLNLRESPNQIEDKQSQVCENWNFEGNKLVNSKRIREVYNLWGTTQIQWIKEYKWDVYFVHSGKFYKNWVEITITTWWPLPDKKVHISIWWDLYFFTFETWDETPYYLDWATLTSVTWVGLPKYNVIYNGKWILGGYDNDNIYFSKTAGPSTKADIYDFSAYSAGNQSVGGDSTWVLTGLAVWENWLYAFKSDESLTSNQVNDTGTVFNFIFQPTSSTWAINQNAIRKVKQDIFYYDGVSKSVRRLSYERDLSTLRDTSISDEIEPIFATLADDQTNATSSYLYPNYKLFLRSEFAWTDYNDVCLTYNVDNKSWTTETNKACFVSDKGWLGSTFEWKIWLDDELPATKWNRIGKQWDFWDGIDNKRYGELEIKGKLQSTLTLFVDVFVDWTLEEIIEINVDENVSGTLWTRTLWTSVLASGSTSEQLVTFRERRNLWLEWQYIEIGLRYEWLGYVEINQRNIQWKPIKGYKTYA